MCKPDMDPFGRPIDYLRISVTDRCNERCFYCLPDGFRSWQPRAETLSYEEILQVVSVAVGLGFKKFRVTGGEPLLRRDAEQFVARLIATPGVVEVGLTTNGTRLAPLAVALAEAGLRQLNVSLDTLDPEAYRRVTGGHLPDVLAGLEAARRAGLSPIKLNTVLMRGLKEDQIWPLIAYAAAHGHCVRFIELMPVSSTDVTRPGLFLSVEEVRRRIAERTALVPDAARWGNGPAVYWHLPQYGVSVGFIGALTTPNFCDRCNKMRLTADGKIRPCLGQRVEFDLKPALRRQRAPEAVREVLLRALAQKPPTHCFKTDFRPHRVMAAIGG